MQPVETIQITDTVRVQLYPDTDCESPLESCEHGIQFITLPDPSRTWRDYADPSNDPYTSIPMLEPGDFYQYREWFEQDGYGQDKPIQTAPSFRTWLNANCAAWMTISRSGYDGTINYQYAEYLDDADAIALVSREQFRSWHGIPDGKPMPRGYRERATKALKGMIDEYNKWATGDCYGYQVQVHDPLCLDCMDPDDDTPTPDCDNWNDTDDSCWGFIGHEYAEEEATRAGMLEAGIPIPQVTHDVNDQTRKGITLTRAEGIPNTESPESRTVLGFDKSGHLTVLTGGKYLCGGKYAYDKYPAVRMKPEYQRDSDHVTVWFERDDQETNDKIVMHRLSWESAQRTMRYLAERSA